MLKKQVWKIVDARLILSFKPPAWVLKFDVSFKIPGVIPQIISKKKKKLKIHP